jgi:hypothetical protein
MPAPAERSPGAEATVSRHGAPSGLAWQIGDAYTLHFWPPFGDLDGQHSGHYSGWAREGRLAARLTDHHLGKGARLTQLQREAGGSWVLADVEHGVTKDREHQLKYRSASRRCSVCKAERDLESGKIGAAEALTRSGWDRASDHERGLLLGIFGLEAAPPDVAVRERRPEPAPFVPAARPGDITPEALAELDAQVDVLCAQWTSHPKAEAEAEMEAEAG